MSDHKDSQFVDSRPMIDIGDFFLWPGESGGPVFMISLNPLTDPDPRITREIHLDAKAVYEFKIDLNGDAVADLSYKITVEGDVPTQRVILRKAQGPDAVSNKPVGDVIAHGESTAYGAGDANVIYGTSGEKLFVGPRQDPFFFDFRGLISPVSDDLRFALSADGLPTDGSAQDTFGPTNVTIIALEVPDLKGREIGRLERYVARGRRQGVRPCGPGIHHRNFPAQYADRAESQVVPLWRRNQTSLQRDRAGRRSRKLRKDVSLPFAADPGRRIVGRLFPARHLDLQSVSPAGIS